MKLKIECLLAWLKDRKIKQRPKTIIEEVNE